jgi:predicted RNA-binding Zn-ribbon protein involved in translation (DUF1610 family)
MMMMNDLLLLEGRDPDSVRKAKRIIPNAEDCPHCGERTVLPIVGGMDGLPTGKYHCIECGWEGKP